MESPTSQAKSERRELLMPHSGRFLFVIPWSLDHAGGVNEVVRNLVRQICQSGYAATILNTEWGARRLRRESSSTGAPYYRLTLQEPTPKEAPVVAALLSFIARFLSTTWQFYRLLRKEYIDTVNFHYPSLSCLPGLIASRLRRKKCKVILSFHGRDLRDAGNASKFSRLVWLWLLARCSHVVCCSQALAGEFQNFFPEHGTKVTVIHNGVDPSDVLSMTADSNLPSVVRGKKVILTVGTLEHKKGQDVLIRAFALIAAQYPDVYLVIMGRSADAAPFLRRLVREKNLESRVYVFENVPHQTVLATMRAAELFVLPSRIEPFGIVILEAGLFGIPVVATETGGVAEIVNDSDCGLLVPVDDIHSLKRAMCAVLGREVDADMLGATLRERVLKTFTWKRATAEYLALIR